MVSPRFEISAEIHYDNTQYYNGHGHAFIDSSVVACVEFSTPAQGNETIEEIADGIISDLNEFYFMSHAENNLELQKEIEAIPDSEIRNAIYQEFSTNNHSEKPYLEYYNPEATETELAEADMYYMGAIHVYLIKGGS